VEQVIIKQPKQSICNNYKHKPKVGKTTREKEERTQKNLFTQFGPN